MNKYYDLIIWDLDGTLYKTDTSTLPAIQQAFQEMNITQFELNSVLDCFGRPTSDFHAWLISHCPKEISAQLIERVDQLELVSISKTGQLYTGIDKLLIDLEKMGFNMAVCSNGYPEYVEEVINAHNLNDLFISVKSLSSSDITKTELVGEILMEHSPQRSIVIGDRIHDIVAAHENNLPAIAVEYGYGPKEELSSADYLASFPSDIPKIVEVLFP